MNIYLSSTLKDLLAERTAVKSALAGQHIVRESYNANESDVRSSCIQDVRESDLYIGIVGLRYGFCPDSGAKSITELEFDAAVEGKIPRLIFIKEEAEIPYPQTDGDEPGGLTRVRKWREYLQLSTPGGVRAAIFKSAGDLGQLVLKSLSEFQERRARRDASPKDHVPEREDKVFDSVQRLLERSHDASSRAFQVTTLHRRIVVQRPHAELAMHEELVNVSASALDERINYFVSDTPIEFKDLAATVRVGIGEESFSGALTATQPKKDGRSFRVRVGFRGRTVAPRHTVILDWSVKFPGSVGLNEDYWVFPCPDERPIGDLICEAVFPSELVDYRFFRIEPDRRREPLTMTSAVLKSESGEARYLYQALQRDTCGMYLMTWRLE